ncbi:MAG: hypothetical protein K2X77_29975 [Candidatus Obscuribacterales bacterium]|nr:hypothetical protein [Candidatus Obscuribacterales bacterium]
MAKNPKLKKLQVLRKLKETVEKRNKMLEHYKVLLAQSALLQKDVKQVNEEIEVLRQFMPDEIPEDLDEYVKKHLSDEQQEH